MKKIILFVFMFALIISACKKKQPDPPPPVPFIKFTINGVQNTWTAYTEFDKNFCVSSTWCARFMLNGDSADNNLIHIGIPGDPIVGKSYTYSDARFVFKYTNQGKVEYLQKSVRFSLVFSSWTGTSGWGIGTFSGWLNSGNGDSLLIENGQFQNMVSVISAE